MYYKEVESLLAFGMLAINPQGGVFILMVTNHYETLLVIETKKTEDEKKAIVDKIKAIIEKAGNLEKLDLWGVRRLAYPINYQTEGYYVVMQFTSNPELPKELDRVYRITDGILRSIVIKRDERYLDVQVKLEQRPGARSSEAEVVAPAEGVAEKEEVASEAVTEEVASEEVATDAVVEELATEEVEVATEEAVVEEEAAPAEEVKKPARKPRKAKTEEVVTEEEVTPIIEEAVAEEEAPVEAEEEAPKPKRGRKPKAETKEEEEKDAE